MLRQNGERKKALATRCERQVHDKQKSKTTTEKRKVSGPGIEPAARRGRQQPGPFHQSHCGRNRPPYSNSPRRVLTRTEGSAERARRNIELQNSLLEKGVREFHEKQKNRKRRKDHSDVCLKPSVSALSTPQEIPSVQQKVRTQQKAKQTQ